jgi:branched-chain amino acid transport system substrate-binding protein
MMNTSKPPAFWSVRGLIGATAVGLLLTSGQAMAADPIKFGVIA